MFSYSELITMFNALKEFEIPDSFGRDFCKLEKDTEQTIALTKSLQSNREALLRRFHYALEPYEVINEFGNRIQALEAALKIKSPSLIEPPK